MRHTLLQVNTLLTDTQNLSIADLGCHGHPEEVSGWGWAARCRGYRPPRGRRPRWSICAAGAATMTSALVCSGGSVRCTSTEHLDTHTHTHTHTLQSAALLPNVWRWRKRWVTQAGTQRGLKYPKYSYHAGLRAGGHFSKTRSIHNIASSVLSVHVLYAAAILHWNTKLCENTELN